MTSIEKFLQNAVTPWMGSRGEHSDIVLSTRIRLARNLAGRRFPLDFSKEEAESVEADVSSVLTGDGEPFSYIPMGSMPALQRQVLVEKHLISPQLADPERPGAVILSDDESVSIMVNEEDHIRIQVIYPGLHLMEAFERANELDDRLEARLPYAFDGDFGFITSCPTNTGTGLRASVMLHLPALSMTSNMGRVAQAVARLGMVVRGSYGEGSDALGNVYQVSNQITLGKSERDILKDLRDLTERLIEQEERARRALRERSAVRLEDRIWRSYGILSNARVLATDEAANRLSDVRLGIDLGIITGVDVSVLNELMIFMQPAFLQQFAGETLQPGERDEFRAKLMRERLGVERGGGEKTED
ncbi:protein arginine kinase [Bhargavaea cecembensis]|uniref:protein arginine kinase n=1 Tax=Bhargavaea cecembensis TaxID=394098 RepID=UPI00058AED4C|nr:protein arginine kinase [Bhargavaea cecembensis]